MHFLKKKNVDAYHQNRIKHKQQTKTMYFDEFTTRVYYHIIHHIVHYHIESINVLLWEEKK